MQSNKTTAPIDYLRQIIDHVRHSPTMRSVVYAGGVVAIAETVWRVYHPTGPYDLVRLHLASIPFVAIWTYTCVQLRPEDRVRWNHIPLRYGIVQLLQGIGLGGGTFLIWLGAAATQGWVSLPEWGWEHTPIHTVIGSLLLLGIGHATVAWNEEMIFRGYGFDTLREAIGPWMAAGVLTALFARAHGTSVLVLTGEAALGLTLVLLRVQSDGLWLPVGYHWAANYIQSALLGPPGAEPSLRPLHVQGPYEWTGRPGYPEPGWLAIIIQFAVAIGVGLVWWLNHQRERHQ